MADTEKKERPKRTVKKTSVVIDNAEFDKYFKKVTKTDKEGRAQTAAEKMKEKSRERELSKERKKAADDLARLAALKKASDDEIKKKEEKEKKAKERKEKADKAKVEKEKKEKEKKEKESKKPIPVPKPSPKCKKPIPVPKPSPKCKKPIPAPKPSPKITKKSTLKTEPKEDSHSDDEKSKAKPVPKPSPLSKKPKGYMREEPDTDADRRTKTSRKLKFDDKASEENDDNLECVESTSQAVNIRQDMVAPLSSEEDSSNAAEDETSLQGKFGPAKQTEQKDLEGIEEKPSTSPKSKQPTFASIDEVDKFLNEAKNAKAKMLTNNMTQKMNRLDSELSQLKKKSDSVLDINELQTQVQDLRKGMEDKIKHEPSADDMLAHMAMMADSTQAMEKELEDLQEKLRLIITKRDARIEEDVNHMTNSMKKYLRTSEAYDKQDLDVFERDLKINYRKFVAQEQKLMANNKDKQVVDDKMTNVIKEVTISLRECIENNFPEFAPIGKAAINHSMKSHKFRNEQLAEENKRKKKVAFSDQNEAESRKKFIDDVINVYEDLEAWKQTFFDTQGEKLSNEDATKITEKYESYKKNLSETCKSDATLKDSVKEFTKIREDIEQFQKDSQSFIDKDTTEQNEEVTWFLTDEEKEEFATYMTDTTLTHLKNSESYDNQNLDEFEKVLKEQFGKYLSSEEDLKKKTTNKKPFVEEIKPFKKSMMVFLIECLSKLIPELAPDAEAALKATMKKYETEKKVIAENNEDRRKAAVRDNVQAANRNQLLQEVMKVHENLKTWKENFFEKNRHHFSAEEAAGIEEKLESYNKMLGDSLKTDTKLEDKLQNLESLKDEISVLQRTSKAYVVESTAEPQKILTEDEKIKELEECHNQCKKKVEMFNNWKNNFFSTSIPNMTENEHKELKKMVTDIIKTTEESIKDLFNKPNLNKFEALAYLEQVADMCDNITLDLDVKKSRQEFIKHEKDVATLTCIVNAMSHLRHEHNLTEANAASVHGAVEDFFTLKLGSKKVDKTTAEDPETPLVKAEIQLTNVLRDIYGDSTETIYNDILQYLDPTRHYVTLAKVTESDAKTKSPEEKEIEGLKEQVTEKCKLMTEWIDERWEKYRDKPELIPTTDFERRIEKTSWAIKRLNEVAQKTTVKNKTILANKLDTFNKILNTCEEDLKNREKSIRQKKKKAPSDEAKSQEGTKSSSSGSASSSSTKYVTKSTEKTKSSSSESASSSSVRYVTRTPTPTPQIALPGNIGDMEPVHSQEDIDFGSIPFSTQINEALANPMEVDDIDVDFFDNFTEEEGKELELQRVAEKAEKRDDDSMPEVTKSQPRTVENTATTSPELESTQGLVGKESGDSAKSLLLKGNLVVADKVSIYVGDITKMKVDAIVNAAKKSLLGGAGVDGAIHKAAGKELLEECQTLNGCKTGEAKITKGYKLPAKTIIHTVGPVGENKAMLQSCYESSMQLMINHNLKTIAFPCISTGIYGYPNEKAASVAIDTVKKFIEKNPEKIDRVTFCIYKETDVEIYKNLMEKNFPGQKIDLVDTRNEDKKRDRSPSSPSDDEHVKASMKRRAAKKRKTKTEMIAALLNPVGREKKAEDVKPKDGSKSKDDKTAKTMKSTLMENMSEKLKSVSSLLKGKKDGEKSHSEKDLTPNSSDHDKTYKPPKKDPPGSSDDFKYELTRGKKKVFTKKRSTPKVMPKETEDKEGEKKEEEKKTRMKRTLERRPNVTKKDFQALGFDLATPTTVSKESFLTWTEALDIVNDNDMQHATLNSYFEPKGNEVYKITNVFTRPEDVTQFSHRDNFFSVAYGGSVKFQEKKRYKYKTKTLEGEWSTKVFYKCIYTFPEQNCILLQYVGDPSKAMQKSEAVEPPMKKGKKHGTSSEEDDIPATKKRGPRLSMLDPSDFEMTDAGEKGDSADDKQSEEELQKDWEKKREESASRKVEKQNNNLAKFFQTVRDEKNYESSQHVPHIPMKKKREAEEAFVLEDEDQAISNKQLDAVITEALRLGEGIENGNETYISVPEGGKVYLFDCRKTQQPWTNMLLNDGFRYKTKNHLYLPNANFDKTKYYAYTYNSEGKRMQPTATFKKYTYFNTQSGILAIHYRGNVDDVSRVPHGNAKKSTQIFIPTSKGIEKDIIEEHKGKSRHKTYHDLTSELPGGVASTIVGPRNLKAVGYLKEKMEHKSWVDNLDEVKKVAIVADYLGDFVRGSTTKPYFAALLATEAGLTELRRVIDKMPANTALEGYYDTTFEFGNQYASIYSYRHPFLQRVNQNTASRSDKPIVPVFFMLHQKKFQQSHEFMFRTAQEAFDKKYSHAKKTFANTRKVLISDKEFDGEKLLGNCKTIHCWNHLKKNISSEAKYKKHVRDKELSKIENDFRNILQTTTEAEYTTVRDKILAKNHWRNTGMADYYMDRIDEDFKNNSARWVLEEWGIGFGENGITNNPAETVNSVIHHTKDDEELKKIHKNYTVPDTMLFFHHYAQCNDKEIRGAYHNTTTDFQVRPEYKGKFQKELKLMPPVYIQDVAEMKQELKERLDPKHEPTEEETPDKVMPPKASEPDAYKKLAEQHIKENRVCKVPNLRCYFGVRDMAHENMVWVDYMVDKCSCPIGTKGQCPHKLAVQIKYSLPEPPVRVRAAAVDKSLAFNPALKKKPRYGKKKPTTDDTHDVAAHGMKKDKASDVKKMKKTVRDEFDVAEDKMKTKSSEEEEECMLVGVETKPLKKVDDPKRVFQCESFDMTSLTQDLDTEQATVMPFTAKVFRINSEDKFAIFSPQSNTAVLLFHQKDKANVETPHIMKLAALSTRRGATFKIHRHNKPMASISYRVVNDNVDLKTAASQLHKRGQWDKAGEIHLELACYCRMPYTIDDDKNNVAKCSNCSSHYHKSCLDDKEKSTIDDSSKKWNCKSCEIPRKIEWGHMGVCTNTCPVDPMFQTVYFAIKDDKELINNFPDDESHNTLKKAMTSIDEGNCFEAQSMWYDVVQKTNPGAFRYPDDVGNFWGNISEISYKPLEAGKKFQRILTCNNDCCPEPYTFQDKTNALFIRANEGPAKDQIDHLLSERSIKKCFKCQTGKVTGDRVSFSSSEDKVWFIEFIGSGFHTEADGIHKDLDFKPVIHIPDQDGIEHEFKLKSITYNHDRRNHFVSIHRVDDSYIYADPLMEKNTTDDTDAKSAKKNFPLRYRAPMPSDHDFHGPNKASITNIIYVRQF